MFRSKSSNSGLPVRKVGADVSILNLWIYLLLQSLASLIFLMTFNMFRQINQWFSISLFHISDSLLNIFEFLNTSSSSRDLIFLIHFPIFFTDGEKNLSVRVYLRHNHQVKLVLPHVPSRYLSSLSLPIKVTNEPSVSSSQTGPPQTCTNLCLSSLPAPLPQ